MLEKFAEKVAEDEKFGISIVTIGNGGKTPEAFRRKQATFADAMKEGYQYGDSRVQGIVYNSTRLLGKIKDVKKTFQSNVFGLADEISSVFHANNLLSFAKDKEIFKQLQIYNGYGFELSELLSNRALKGYEKEYFKFADLKDLDAEKICGLTSEWECAGYEKGYFKFADREEIYNYKRMAKCGGASLLAGAVGYGMSSLLHVAPIVIAASTVIAAGLTLIASKKLFYGTAVESDTKAVEHKIEAKKDDDVHDSLSWQSVVPSNAVILEKLKAKDKVADRAETKANYLDMPKNTVNSDSKVEEEVVRLDMR